jgi:signal transduction histidine kinase
VIFVDRDWRLLYLNGRAESRVADGRDLRGVDLWEAFPALAETEFGAAYRRAITEGVPTRAEAFYPRLDGWFAACAYPSDEGLAIFFRDVSEEKRIEASLRDSERQQEELQRQLLNAQRLETLGSVAGGIAHDLSNALMPVVALSKLLLAEVPEESRAHECLKLVHAAGQQARDLVRRILTLAREREPEREPVDLPAFVAEALPLLRSTLPTTINLRPALARTPPIRADRAQLSQVLLNLVKNAVDAIGDRLGEIAIEVVPGADESIEGGAAIRLSVTDTGCGMDDETRRRAFEPFFTTKPSDAGTGLGLSVVQKVVTSHGGSISVSSRPGHGTRFDILFPVSAGGTGTPEGAPA